MELYRAGVARARRLAGPRPRRPLRVRRSRKRSASAERLVGSLAALPLYRDVARYDELEVPFYKRAQITVADLARVFGGSRLRPCSSIWISSPSSPTTWFPTCCAATASSSTPRPSRHRSRPASFSRSGSRAEVEIRAVAVEAVERLVARLAETGRPTTAHALDGLLWNAGQADCDQGATAASNALQLLLRWTVDGPRRQGSGDAMKIFDGNFWIMVALLAALSAVALVARRDTAPRRGDGRRHASVPALRPRALRVVPGGGTRREPAATRVGVGGAGREARAGGASCSRAPSGS